MNEFDTLIYFCFTFVEEVAVASE